MMAGLRLGELEAAITDYDAALSINPRIAESFYGRGIAKGKLGDADGARRHRGGQGDQSRYIGAVCLLGDIRRGLIALAAVR